jgi:predicted DNA-binding protein YlxM (UPF0122 family)
MGYGIDFTANIYLSRQSYSSKGEVEDRIREIDKDLNNCEALLHMYAVASPRDVSPPEDEPIFYLKNRVNETLEEYQDLLSDRYGLEFYLEYLNDGGEIIKSE